jgi:hypothetical protein
MQKVIPIFKIKSNQNQINFADFDVSTRDDFGNGFLIAKNGTIASVAHVLNNNDGLNPYGLINGNLFKIEVINQTYSEIDVNHKDAAIGKIYQITKDYFDPLNFEKVVEYSNLKIRGYSIKNFERDLLNENNKENFELFYVEKEVACMGSVYYYTSDLIPMINFFSVAGDFFDYRSLSGSPVLNENKRVVGIFKGGVLVGNKFKGSVLHIKILSEMINKYCGKNT